MPTVAILGASADRSKFGNKSVRAHQQQGYTVYPVNPKADEIEGLKAFKSLAEVPAGKLDRISVYLPPQVGLAVLPDFDGAHPVLGVWLVDGAPAGLGVRESDALITDNLSRFVPHLIDG